jgi:hypothetical protein
MKKKLTYSLLVTLSLLAGAAVAGIKPSDNARTQTVEADTTLTVAGTVDITGTFKVGGTAVTATAGNLNGVRTGQEYQVGFSSAKVGATAGWVVAAAANLYEWTVPASQTASTLVVPVNGLHVGDTITAFKCEVQIESAGNTATLDGDLRKLTNAAADPTDASVGAFTQVSVTADTKAEPAKTALSDVVGADERFYILLTATTAASTDMRALGCTVTTTTS